jgi:threonine dehydratase
MFHYSNQGGDFGLVLAGVQVPKGEEESFQQFLDQLAYPYAEETENPAYRLFLQGVEPV